MGSGCKSGIAGKSGTAAYLQDIDRKCLLVRGTAWEGRVLDGQAGFYVDW